MRKRLSTFILCSLAVALPASAADVQGRITDRTGGALPSAVVRVTNVASGELLPATADSAGRFQVANLRVGIYRVSVTFPGFSEASRTVIVSDAAETLSVDFELELGSIKSDVTVSADRGERDVQVVPLRIDTVRAETLQELAPVSTGDALLSVPGVTAVGSGPFQVRPRLRGLDSTRLLVLVDGERLNNARTDTDRAGVEVGLVDPNSIEAIEVLGGAGSVLYGTDALSGTINIITHRARLSPAPQFTAGFDGLYSSNEDGRRGTVTVGASNQRVAVSFTGGSERFGNYSAGSDFEETSQPFFTSGQIKQADTIDDNFGFTFKKFPDPFNAPFSRTSAAVPRSSMEGSSAYLSGLAAITKSQTLEMTYQRRRASNIGFPDFDQPFFFQKITLPWSRFDKFSATYSFTNLAPWLPKLTARSYIQRQDRLLRNDFPVQFPVPSASFFPISVFRLQILSDTRQQVSTPGIDVQATFLPRLNNLLTAGVTMFRDRSKDERETTTQMSQIGQVALGQFGPAATVFATPVLVGPPSVDHPVRVPDASLRDLALFLHDEWDLSRAVRITSGIRVDRYSVTTGKTTGYEVASLVGGAVPAIEPSTLPNVNGEHITRNAITGEAGVVLWSAAPINVFGHYVRSYRHPNLAELLFAGPATVGNIVPNVSLKPETGHNVDVGMRFRQRGLTGSLSYFNNTYNNFISTEVVANPTSDDDSISQAINFTKVRIQGVETEASAPFVTRALSWLPSASITYNRGTVLAGENPLTGISLAGVAQDNISPWKISAGVRASDRQDRCWVSYGVRTQAKVTRVSPLLSDSPFLIAQDLMGLAGFSIHRVAVGYQWRRSNQRLGLTVAVDNLTDKFYREQFQFAPSRGRSFTVKLNVGGVK